MYITSVVSMHLLSLPAVLWSELVQYWDLLLALYFSYYASYFVLYLYYNFPRI
eukprot:SAG11_NODE_3627_length_2326_cov_11.512348_1_plen_53_part_00